MDEYRGKGICQGKFIKGTNIPKHAGNFSYSTIHYQSHQSKDYRVRKKNGELIVGDHTPLARLIPAALVELIATDPNFSLYAAKGTHTHGNKQYEAYKSLKKFEAYGWHSYLDFQYIYREEIYTDGDFEYQFPNY